MPHPVPKAVSLAVVGSSSRLDGLWRWYVAGGLLVANAYLVLNGLAGQFVVFDTFGAACLLAVILGPFRSGVSARLPWHLAAAGVGLQLVGGIVFQVYLLHDGVVPQPSFADPIFLASYGFFAAACIGLIRERARKEDLPALIDAAMIGIGVGVGSWLIAGPTSFKEGTLAGVVALAYPALDAVALGAAARLAFDVGRPSFSTGALLASLGFLLGADTLFAHDQLHGSFVMSGLAPLGFLLAFLCIALAALHPSIVRVSERSTPSATGRIAQRVLSSIAALLGPVALVVDPGALGGSRILVIGITSFVLVVLVLIRSLQAIHEREEETARELALRRSATAFVGVHQESDVGEVTVAAVGVWASHVTQARLYVAHHEAFLDTAGIAPPLPLALAEALMSEGLVELRDLPGGLGEALELPSETGTLLVLPVRAAGGLGGALLVGGAGTLSIEARAGLRMVCAQAGRALESLVPPVALELRRMRTACLDLIAGSSDFTVVFDAYGSITYGSAGFASVLRIDQSSLVGLPLDGLVIDGDLATLVSEDEAVEEIRFQGAHGAVRTSVCLGALPIETSDLSGYLIAGRWDPIG
jgi:PAS domain-containing protein